MNWQKFLFLILVKVSNNWDKKRSILGGSLPLQHKIWWKEFGSVESVNSQPNNNVISQ